MLAQFLRNKNIVLFNERVGNAICQLPCMRAGRTQYVFDSLYARVNVSIPHINNTAKGVRLEPGITQQKCDGVYTIACVIKYQLKLSLLSPLQEQWPFNRVLFRD